MRRCNEDTAGKYHTLLCKYIVNYLNVFFLSVVGFNRHLLKSAVSTLWSEHGCLQMGWTYLHVKYAP